VLSSQNLEYTESIQPNHCKIICRIYV